MHNIIFQIMYRFEGSVARRVLNPLLTIDSIFWLTSLGHNTKKRVADIQRFTGQVKSYDAFSQVILNKTKFTHNLFTAYKEAKGSFEK